MNCWTCDDRESPLPSGFGQLIKLSGLCCRQLDRDRVVRDARRTGRQDWGSAGSDPVLHRPICRLIVLP
jgi:hypothetical protein